MKMNVNDEYDHLLPLSLIESQILPRLTAKSVGRCRCVCKQWKSFLSAPSFARTNIPNNDYKLLLVEDQGNLRTLPDNILHANPDPSDVYILASLDGLVCLGSKSIPTKLLFWNPLTGAYRKLCDPHPHYPFFDLPPFWDGGVGFYKDSSNDYKLVIVMSTGVCDFGAYVYSHKLDIWKEIDFNVGDMSSVNYTWSSAISCGQCLYFTVECICKSRRSWIICFDVETETFRSIPFPHVPTSPPCGSLVVLNGRVHLCVSYTSYILLKLNELAGDEEYIDFELLKELWRMDGDGWVKVSAFSEPLDNGFRSPYICTTTSGNSVIVLDEEINDSFKKMSTEDFTRQYRYFRSPSWEYRCSRMIYVESLVSPNCP
ncbi:hypothetical protein QVD17_31582 [Tagetes erecta]|uniref:F-box domain-containing protein n=1 Tax=Tagetes erecta TaxID=13708 RepID=A0AAD8KA33_TARER|nr:hypothetical protein QVD17_31582 [Tagetes erecta]